MSKASDTHPHQANDAALKRLALRLAVRDTVSNSYKNLLIDTENRVCTTEITMKRGIKQCDPLSLFTFNAISTH